MASPKCKCGYDTTHFVALKCRTNLGEYTLIYCDNCGNIIGVK